MGDAYLNSSAWLSELCWAVCGELEEDRQLVSTDLTADPSKGSLQDEHAMVPLMHLCHFPGEDTEVQGGYLTG